MNIDGVETHCAAVPLEIWKYVKAGEVWEDPRDGTRVVIEDFCKKSCRKPYPDHFVTVSLVDDATKQCEFPSNPFIKYWRKVENPSRA